MSNTVIDHRLPFATIEIDQMDSSSDLSDLYRLPIAITEIGQLDSSSDLTDLPDLEILNSTPSVPERAPQNVGNQFETTLFQGNRDNLHPRQTPMMTPVVPPSFVRISK